MIAVPISIANIVLKDGKERKEIDGNFEDWVGEKLVSDRLGDSIASRDLSGYKMSEDERGIMVYVCKDKVNFFEGSGGEILHVFLDVDRDANSGYSIKGLGADIMVSLHGWDEKIRSATISEYKVRGSGEYKNYDWNSWEVRSSVSAQANGKEIEFLISKDYLKGNTNPMMYITLTGSEGDVDEIDAVFSVGSVMLYVEQRGVGPRIAMQSPVSVLQVMMTAIGGDVTVSSITFMKLGAERAPDAELILYEDSREVGRGRFSSGIATIIFSSEIKE